MSGSSASQPVIGLLGFGEVGQVLGSDLAGRPRAAWDILFADPGSEPSRAIDGSDIRRCASAGQLAAGCDLILSAVTAAEAVNAARSVADSLRPGAVFLDLNSVAPGTRQQAAGIIDEAGGRYVEAAVMAPIGPRRIGTPMLLGGPHAEPFRALAGELGFSGASVYDARLGRASAAKLCRSVVVKGLESLVTESLLTARCHGVEDDVIASLGNLFAADWRELGYYLVSRSLRHGERRAAEMREAAAMVAQAGLEPLMSSACAARQQRTAASGAWRDAGSLTELLDAMLNNREKGIC